MKKFEIFPQGCRTTTTTTTVPRVTSVVLSALLLLLTFTPTQLQETGSDNVITYEILEEQPQNSFIGNLISDAGLDTQYESDVLEELRFNFLTQSSVYKEYFVIEEKTGLFRTQKTLDRDMICSYDVECWIHLDVALQPVQYFQIIKVSIKVIDINDNYPTFPEGRVELFISETTTQGASFAIPGAEDADTGSFAVQSYHLVSSDVDVFELRTTGESVDGNADLQLVLKEKLDREVKDFFSLRVVAKDGGIPQKTGAIIVDVTVVDANDNNPQFINHTYEAFVFENLPTGSVILTVKAEDQDDGENGEITYDFSRATKNMLGYLFGINSFTGEIFAKDKIDFEENEEFTLGVVAKDQGPNALADYAKVVIHVGDVNDHAPHITVNAMSESGVAQIREGTEDDAFVAHISVVDPDGGINGEFSCSIDSPHFRLVQLFPTEYKVVSAGMFDREIQDRFETTLICQDKGQNPQSATLQLQIEVTDANDHAPKFTSDFYTVNIRENNGMDEFLTQLNATDADLGINAQVTYSITGEQAHLIKVDPKSGMVTTNGVFDFEMENEFSFSVVATDNGQPSLSSSATLTISVLDVNDELPKFPQKTYSFGTFENQPSGTEIGTMAAFDLDTAPFNVIIYTFDYTKGDVGIFKIDLNSGKITTRKVLDREERDTYHFTVIARNDGYLLSSSVNVTVYVADQNDNSPIITFPSGSNNTVQVSTFGAADDFVTRIEAYDLDIATNAQLEYSILGGSGQDLFNVNPFTGQVTIKENLIAYADQTLQMTVLVQDKGEVPLSSLADLYVHINSSLVPVASRHLGGDLSETNLVVIICLSIVAVVLLVFVLLVVLVFRRRRSNTACHHPKPSCTCKKCRVAKYVQYEQAQGVPSSTAAPPTYKDCTYVRATDPSDSVSSENGGFTNGNAVYLQMDPKDVSVEVEQKKPGFFETLFGGKSRNSSDRSSNTGSLGKKRKVHFADGDQPNKAYQAVNSTASSPSKSPAHQPGSSTACPDLLLQQQYVPVQGRCREEKLGQKKEGGSNWQMEEPRQRLFYRNPQQQLNKQQQPQQMQPLQVKSLLNTTPTDDTSDHGSSCDSGRGPSEEEQDHSRHSNNLSDQCLFPSADTKQNPHLQHLHCSCKPGQVKDSFNTCHRDSFNSLKNVNVKNNGANVHRPSSALGYESNFERNGSYNGKNSPSHIWSTNSPTHAGAKPKCACPHDVQKCVKVAPPPPRRSSTLMTSKPLPELPLQGNRDILNDSADGDSEGESTTTSGSYMVDAILDLSGDGPQISPCDVYV